MEAENPNISPPKFQNLQKKWDLLKHIPCPIAVLETLPQDLPSIHIAVPKSIPFHRVETSKRRRKEKLVVQLPNIRDDSHIIPPLARTIKSTHTLQRNRLLNCRSGSSCSSVFDQLRHFHPKRDGTSLRPSFYSSSRRLKSNSNCSHTGEQAEGRRRRSAYITAYTRGMATPPPPFFIVCDKLSNTRL